MMVKFFSNLYLDEDMQKLKRQKLKKFKDSNSDEEKVIPKSTSNLGNSNFNQEINPICEESQTQILKEKEPEQKETSELAEKVDNSRKEELKPDNEPKSQFDAFASQNTVVNQPKETIYNNNSFFSKKYLLFNHYSETENKQTLMKSTETRLI